MIPRFGSQALGGLGLDCAAFERFRAELTGLALECIDQMALDGESLEDAVDFVFAVPLRDGGRGRQHPFDGEWRREWRTMLLLSHLEQEDSVVEHMA